MIKDVFCLGLARLEVGGEGRQLRSEFSTQTYLLQFKEVRIIYFAIIGYSYDGLQ